MAKFKKRLHLKNEEDFYKKTIKKNIDKNFLATRERKFGIKENENRSQKN